MAETVWSVTTTHKQVAFTFDDGPKPEYSLPLIEMLDKLQVHATFFVVGHEAKANLDLIRRLNDQGHEIANHTYTHHRLPALHEDVIAQELSDTNMVIRSVTGSFPRFFRPPGGQFNTKVLSIAEAHGLTAILWDVNAGDYILESGRVLVPDESRRGGGKSSVDTVVENIVKNTHPGSIVLMHNGGVIVDALPKIVTQLRNKGFEIVTVGELLRGGIANNGQPQGETNVPD
jgi:peptidoglycan/xylan/chitin deacetylase (PgdA/CDA1 family)